MSTNQLLSQRLANGLFSVIKRKQLERKIKPVASLTFAASGVQRHILSMTEQLHSSEIERKQLRATEIKLREQIVKQRHALELNNSKLAESDYTELKTDFDTLRVDYGELTKVVHKCELELKQGLESAFNQPPHDTSDVASSTVVGGSTTIVPSENEASACDEEHRQMQQWLVAQKGALGRIDALQEQIGAYRARLVENHNEHQAAQESALKLNLSELNQ